MANSPLSPANNMPAAVNQGQAGSVGAAGASVATAVCIGGGALASPGSPTRMNAAQK